MKQLYQNALNNLIDKDQYRSIPDLCHQQQWVKLNNQDKQLINIASNDYLGIGANSELQAEFFDYYYQQPVTERPKFGSTSSRLLTGNDQQLQQLENELTQWYNLNSKPSLSALVFNSGYHSNLGILPAISVLPSQTGNTLILADKLVHASIIDGIRLASLNKKCNYKRYRHNDYQHLRQLIKRSDDDHSQGGLIQDGLSQSKLERIIIVSESIFSMDGDLANLAELVAIKSSDSRIELYIDEAHAVGVMGETGLGLAQSTDTLADIDYLIGTFGKAFAGMGAYIICQPVVKDWLINSMRPLIYSTALPPMTHAWSRFVLQKISGMQPQRQHLIDIANQLRQAIETKTEQANPSQSAIIPYILGTNSKAINKAKELQQAGFYALPIRPPTVPPNTARIRLVMNAGLMQEACERLIECL